MKMIMFDISIVTSFEEFKSINTRESRENYYRLGVSQDDTWDSPIRAIQATRKTGINNTTNSK